MHFGYPQWFNGTSVVPSVMCVHFLVAVELLLLLLGVLALYDIGSPCRVVRRWPCFVA